MSEAEPDVGKLYTAPREEFARLSLDKLADAAARAASHQLMSRNAFAEIKRREMLAQIEANNATRLAAEATRDAAIQSRRSAFWMMWSVIVAAFSAAVAAASAVSAWYSASKERGAK